jgi:N-acetylglucosaminyldiphosphoundecaprenol N-acetyl-beta-D-mannosaminyltransferase
MHIDRAALVAARQSFLNVEFDAIDDRQVLALIQSLSRRPTFSYIVTPNVDHIIRLTENGPDRARFVEAYEGADRIVCDSRILASLASRHGIDLPVVTGSDLTAALFERTLKSGDRVAVIGGTARLIEELMTRFPHPVYLHHQPPMGLLGDPSAISEVVDFVQSAKAHYILFAVGAPQSEIVAHLCKTTAQASGVGLCIGASLEFLTGSKMRAPSWMQRLRMEWLFRLLSEPRRLGSRYLIGAFKLARLYWRWRSSTARSEA